MNAAHDCAGSNRQLRLTGQRQGERSGVKRSSCVSMNPVTTQAVLLVASCTFSLGYMVTGGNSQLAKYVLAWALFHASEYVCTSRYSPRTKSPYSFLIYGATGSVHLAASHLLSVCEYVITQRFWVHHGIPKVGFVLALTGILVRARAIHDCGDSFSHYIETSSPRRLVTCGAYAWCRHPSYAGFVLYVVGMQAILGNLFVFVASVVVLIRFFTRRIEIEEHFLIDFYGPAYLQYKARVRALVPCIY
ncbi:hypothetical protein OXX59_002820 [Metschnikowia pulcherrima]